MWERQKIVDTNALKMMINRKSAREFSEYFLRWDEKKNRWNFYLFTYLAAFLIRSLRSLVS